jgi:hypothetical protein
MFAVILGLLGASTILYWVSEGLLIAGRPVVIRNAALNDKTVRRYIGFDVDEVDVVRNIAVAEGTFSKDTWLSTWLYVVRSGKIENGSGFTVGRSPNRIGEPNWINMRIRLALAETERSDGRAIYLGTAGQTRGQGGIGEIIRNFPVTEKQTFPGRIEAGKRIVLHVEGDRQFSVNREMSVETFARQNEGNFLVIVIQLN